MSDTAPTKPIGTITADHVATEAGVSRWTVTRAFREDAPISEKSRKKVLEAANRLGYAPDLLAAGLRSDRSNLVALLVDDFQNPHKLVIMERLSYALRKSGWGTLLVNTLDEGDTPAALLDASQRRVDAAVLIGIQFDDSLLATALGARRIKKLIVFARYSANPNTISICTDDESAMAAIADYVIRKRYRRPLFLAGPQTSSAHVTRKETFLSIWHRALGTEPPFVSVAAYDPLLAFDRVSEYLKTRVETGRPDVLVCENDALAMGAVDAIRYEFGLRVPEDIAVTGFDDVPQAASPHYRLTTYRQPIATMAESLVSVLKGDAAADGLTRFTGEMVIRDSA